MKRRDELWRSQQDVPTDRGSDFGRLCRLGASSGFAAVGVAAVQVALEVVGVTVLHLPVPRSVEEWFDLVQRQRLVALAELTTLQIPMFVLLVPLFIAIHAVVRRRSPAVAQVATALALIGVGVYLASNTALSIVSLSDRWAETTSDADRGTILAAGQAMLAEYDGPGLGAGVVLVMVATLVFSSPLRELGVIGRAGTSAGLCAGMLAAVYYVGAALPFERILVLEAAGVVFLLWVYIVSRGLLRQAAAVRSSALAEGD